MKNRYYIIIALLIMIFASCQQEELYTGPCDVKVRAYIQDEVSVTRGYTNINQSGQPNFTAELIVSNGSQASYADMNWSNGSLSTNLRLEEGGFCIYGYAPKTIDAKLEGEIMTVPNVPGLSKTDALVINPQEITIGNSTTTEVALRMDHLMAKITPRFYLDATYANMRSIRIKTVEFLLPSASYTATVNYNVDEDSDKPYKVEWSVPITAESTTEITTYENEKPEDEQKLVTVDTNEQNYGHCYICPNQATGSLLMRVTYDVYDKVNKETPIRSDEVVNKVIIKQNGTTIDKLTAGNNYILIIKVVPTYLYVLSDNDLGSVLVIP